MGAERGLRAHIS